MTQITANDINSIIDIKSLFKKVKLLVVWKGFTEEQASWEDLDVFNSDDLLPLVKNLFKIKNNSNKHLIKKVIKEIEQKISTKLHQPGSSSSNMDKTKLKENNCIDLNISIKQEINSDNSNDSIREVSLNYSIAQKISIIKKEKFKLIFNLDYVKDYKNSNKIVKDNIKKELSKRKNLNIYNNNDNNINKLKYSSINDFFSKNDWIINKINVSKNNLSKNITILDIIKNDFNTKYNEIVIRGLTICSINGIYNMNVLFINKEHQKILNIDELFLIEPILCLEHLIKKYIHQVNIEILNQNIYHYITN